MTALGARFGDIDSQSSQIATHDRFEDANGKASNRDEGPRGSKSFVRYN